MAEQDQLVLYTAAYETLAAALAALDAIEQLHKDEMIGKYDAAVIDKRFLTRHTLWHARAMLRFLRKHPERLLALR